MNSTNPYLSPQDPKIITAPSADAVLAREVLLRGSMPVKDVLHTQWLVLSKRWIYALVCLGLYVAFVLALGLLNPADWMFGATFMVLGLIVMPAILPLTLLMVYLRLLRDSHRQIGIFARTETVLAPDGIRSSMNEEDVSIPWSTFSGFLCSQRVVLLFLRDSNNHLIISRTKLAQPEDWDVLLDFLHSRYSQR